MAKSKTHRSTASTRLLGWGGDAGVCSFMGRVFQGRCTSYIITRYVALRITLRTDTNQNKRLLIDSLISHQAPRAQDTGKQQPTGKRVNQDMQLNEQKQPNAKTQGYYANKAKQAKLIANSGQTKQKYNITQQIIRNILKYKETSKFKTDARQCDQC